uniref:Uncharacterized protein n=1 Tax=Ditylenchus dipsaci TaxID=166011 RepID=A0A915CPW4_9BILA
MTTSSTATIAAATAAAITQAAAIQTTTTANPNCLSTCPNGTWSSWQASTACNDTCGRAECRHLPGLVPPQLMDVLQVSFEVNGPSTASMSCNFSPCDYPRMSCCNSKVVMPSFDEATTLTRFILTTAVQAMASDATLPADNQCTTTQHLQSQELPLLYPLVLAVRRCVGSWSPYLTCQDTCGSCGTQTRSRTCTSEASGCPCTGSTTNTINCNLAPCPYPRQSCCNGLRAMAVNGAIICGPQASNFQIKTEQMHVHIKKTTEESTQAYLKRGTDYKFWEIVRYTILKLKCRALK